MTGCDLRLTAFAMLLVGMSAAIARGDAGAVVLSEEQGPIIVTLLAGPLPPGAGPVEWAVLVQSSETEAPLLDVASTLRLTSPDGHESFDVAMRPGVDGNRLLRGARVELRPAGRWQVELVLHDASGARADLRTDLELSPAPAPARRHWLAIMAGPAGLALLAMHQTLALTRSRRRGRRKVSSRDSARSC